ncbi:hypothetical protein PVK06_043113 [Gossypium arboreum]|uniref:RNase H type-1 domain-containing protein n=2 Tax=Gossypium arboreum TaxID=29729 RepID=A0ABR0MN05_GOSAR|nr:hypothetical protein PVK06_043113 [Gossypium arboreum]
MVNANDRWLWTKLEKLCLRREILLNVVNIMAPNSEMLGQPKIVDRVWHRNFLDRNRGEFLNIEAIIRRSNGLSKYAMLNKRMGGLNSQLMIREIRWEKPPIGWIKLNKNRVVAAANGLGAVGGIFQNAQGEWIAEYFRVIGFSSTLQAELWVVVDGLGVQWVMGFRQIFVELDSADVINLINSTQPKESSLTLDRAISRIKGVVVKGE